MEKFALPSQFLHTHPPLTVSARLVLNYKSLPYRTLWIEYPDIAPTFKSLNIPPNPSPAIPFTSPMITLPSGEHVMESTAIAQALEHLHPDPPLHLDSPMLDRLQTHGLAAITAVRGIFMPRVPSILNPASQPYFHETRSARLGMSLPEYEVKEGGEKAWEAATPHLKEVAKLLHEDESGPFLLGKEVSYADFVLVGFLQFCKRLGDKDDDIFQRIVGIDKAFKEIYDASKKWLERDDH